MALEAVYLAVHDVLAELQSSAAVPMGARKTILAVGEALREAGAPDTDVETVGMILAVMHQWDLALCLGNVAIQDLARSRIVDLAARWPMPLPVAA